MKKYIIGYDMRSLVEIEDIEIINGCKGAQIIKTKGDGCIVLGMYKTVEDAQNVMLNIIAFLKDEDQQFMYLDQNKNPLLERN